MRQKTCNILEIYSSPSPATLNKHSPVAVSYTRFWRHWFWEDLPPRLPSVMTLTLVMNPGLARDIGSVSWGCEMSAIGQTQNSENIITFLKYNASTQMKLFSVL